MSSYNFGTTSGIAGMLGDYNSIRNGSYSKLMKSYYNSAETSDSTKSSSTKSTNVLDKILEERKNPTVSTETASANSTLNASVKSLKSAVSKLQESSTYEDSEGGSDAKSKTASALREYVSSYNDAVSSSKKSSLASVSSNISGMQKASAENADLLKEVGITINSDGTLYLDESSMKNLNVSKVEELFSSEDTNSYGSTVSNRITRANYYVEDTTAAADSTTSTVASSTDLKGAISNILSDDANFSEDGALSLAKDLVKYYNEAVSSAKSTSNTGVASNLGTLLSKTQDKSDLLSTVGITVGSSGNLSLNTNTFSSADEATKQSVLQNYAASIETNASLLNYYASTGSNTTSSYSSSGSYYTASSDLISSMFSSEV